LLIALPGKLAEGSFSDPPCFAGRVQQVEFSKALKSWTTSSLGEGEDGGDQREGAILLTKIPE
jgi:hypothetical protein